MAAYGEKRMAIDTALALWSAALPPRRIGPRALLELRGPFKAAACKQGWATGRVRGEMRFGGRQTQRTSDSPPADGNHQDRGRSNAPSTGGRCDPCCNRIGRNVSAKRI